jgi:aminoglycoside phosphotransferase (APT) family kinase protein
MTSDEIQQRLQAFYDTGMTSVRHPRVADVVLLGSGYETDVFAFTLQTRSSEGAEESQALVLRVYAGEDVSEKAEREFDAMNRLRKIEYPVPQVLALQRDWTPLGRPFLIMERIHGVSLDSACWSATLEQRQELQTLHFQLMVRLHALEGKAILPDSPLAASRDPYNFIDHEIAMLSELLQRLEGREPPSLHEVLRWLHSRRESLLCARLSVIHGDFHRNNILIDTEGAPVVIDWSNVRLADYRTDLAWTRLILSIIRQVTSLPDDSEAELRMYEECAGKPVTQIEIFEAIACTRLLLSVLISLQFGAARQGMRPEAEALMRRDTEATFHAATLLQERTGLKMPDLEEALSLLLK